MIAPFLIFVAFVAGVVIVSPEALMALPSFFYQGMSGVELARGLEQANACLVAQ